MKVLRYLFSLIFVLALGAGPAEAKTIKVKLATLAPDGSPLHELLKDLKVEWDRISDGQVKLRIYAGGIAGDEPVVMRKMGINNYHAALMSSQGLSSITTSVRVFTIPRMLRTNEELDRAMEILAPEIEETLAKKGYIVLAWADAGWIRFFVPSPDASVAAVQKHRLMSWAGDSEGLKMWKDAGFHVVPLPATEMVTGLKTNLINAFDTMPWYALLSQAYRHADFMIDMKWAPLPGALVITKKTWETIPEEIRPELLKATRKFTARFREETRRMDVDAIEAMKERGLQVITPTPDQIKAWDDAVKAAYPEMRGLYVSEKDFDRFVSVVEQVRKESP